MANSRRLVSITLPFFFVLSSASRVTYNVQKFGAKPNGRFDSTKAFLSSWAAACASIKSATIYVPQGRYLLGAATFWGNECKNNAITIRIDGTLVAPTDYRTIGNSGNWIKFARVNGLTISGGTLDGKGSSLWNCKDSGKHCPAGATTLGFYHSNNIVVSRLTSLNSQMFHVILYGCHNAKLQGMKITAPDNSPNTDGIHIQGSSGVTIVSSNIGTGDDCISIGPGTSNLWIENVSCGPGHGISIGSLGWDLQEAGVRNITVRKATFRDTQNGLRIKTWARPSNGFVRAVTFENVVMMNVRYPIIIDQSYCPSRSNCPNQGSGIKISGVTYRQIHGTSSSQVAIAIGCSKASPCRGIRLQDVKLSYKNQPAQASCSNAAGTSSGLVQPTGCL